MSTLKQVKVNFTESDYMIIKERAINKNISIAEFIRKKLKVSIENPPPPNTSGNLKKIDPYLLYELNNISKSLNEIADGLSSNIEINTLVLIKIYQDVMSLKC